MSTIKTQISSNQGTIKENTGFTDWLWVAMEANGSLTTPRRDDTGGSILFIQTAGLIADVYETPFEATANSTERIHYLDTADVFGNLCRLDTLSSGWLIQLFHFRCGADASPAALEGMFAYGSSGNSDGFWQLRYAISNITTTFNDANGDSYAPASYFSNPDINSDCIMALAFDMNNKTCSLFMGSTALDLAMPRTTGASFAAVAASDLPAGTKPGGLTLQGRLLTGGTIDTGVMYGSDRTKNGADEGFAKNSMVIRAENAKTKTLADVGELLGDLFDSLPNLPAVMENWGDS